MFHTDPVVQSATSVLESQLLRNGIKISSNGKSVTPSVEFQQHIDDYWGPFTRLLLHELIVKGHVVVAFEYQNPECATNRSTYDSMANWIVSGQKPGLHNTAEKTTDGQSKRKKQRSQMRRIIPVVVANDRYELSYVYPEKSYQKQYIIRRNERFGSVIDEESMLIVYKDPDKDGKVNSIMSSIYSFMSFIDSITESAATSEINSSEPTVFVEDHPPTNTVGIGPSDSFPDYESSEIVDKQTRLIEQQRVEHMRLQKEYAKIINAHTPTPRETTSQSSSAYAARTNAQTRDMMGVRIFPLPQHQRLANNSNQPRSRTDLEALHRLSIDYKCTAFGVPSNLLFEGRFSGKTNAQMCLLNNTVQQLSLFISSKLTLIYQHIYGVSDKSNVHSLEIKSYPLTSIDDIINIHNSKLVSYETLIPLTLTSIGESHATIEQEIEAYKEQLEKSQLGETTDKTVVSSNPNTRVQGNGSDATDAADAAVNAPKERK